MTKEYRLIKELDQIINRIVDKDQNNLAVQSEITDLDNLLGEIKENLTRLDGASRFNEAAMREAIDSITEVVDLDSN